MRFGISHCAVLAGFLVGSFALTAGVFVDDSALLPSRNDASYATLMLDVDGDGDRDLLVAQAGGVTVLVNNGNAAWGELSLPLPVGMTGFTCRQLTMLDIDADNAPDVFAVNARGGDVLWRNDGAGGLLDVSAECLPAGALNSIAATPMDADGDGDVDVVIASREGGPRLLLNDGAGTFTDAGTGFLPGPESVSHALLAADLDGDGDADLVTFGPDGDRLFLNGGLANFTTGPVFPQLDGRAIEARAADMDGDGDLDIVVAAGDAGVQLLLNNGGATFTPAPGGTVPDAGSHVVRLGIADLDVDGDADLFVACFGPDRLWRNDGTGVFVDAASDLPAVDSQRTFGCVFGDLDADLDPDLFLARPRQQNLLWRNAMPEPRVRLSVTPAAAVVGQPVKITVQAVDEDGLDDVALTVGGIPVELTDGEAEYTPTAAGDYEVRVVARDTLGNATTRVKQLSVLPNVAPTITLGGNVVAFPGQPFERAGSFVDPGGTAWTATVDYGDGTTEPLALAPDQTFLLQHAYGGFGTYLVTVRVDDGDGGIGTGTLQVRVTSPPPVLRQIPDMLVQDGVAFPPIHLDHFVADPDHASDELSWEISGQAAFTVGISADRVATITYSPGLRATEELTFTVTDPMGEHASCTASFTVVEPSDDHLRPVVEILLGSRTATPGEAVTITVNVTDDSAIIHRELRVNGVALVLDQNGQATFTSGVAAVCVVEATATDSAGNEGYATAELRFLTPGDETPPTAVITAPEHMDDITGVTEIIGTATDANLLRYTLAYATHGTDWYTTFAQGAKAVTDGVLGAFDSTSVRNGLYDIRLIAEDSSGNTTTVTRTCQVDHRVKIGKFRIRLVDLVLPVVGINVEIIRTYDSQNLVPGDFGVGWSLGMTDVRIYETQKMGEGWFMSATGGAFQSYALHEPEPHFVAVAFPDDSLDVFRLVVEPGTSLFHNWWEATASFEACPGTTSTLESVGTNQIVTDNGPGDVNLWLWDFSKLYDPQTYRLTTRRGFVYVIDKENGLQSVTSPNGHTVTFTVDGITHSAGRGVGLVRDEQGRITEITDSKGNTRTYQYDAYGDLVASVDQVGATTHYIYDRNHRMIDMIGPSGRSTFRNEYDEDGRLIATMDGSGDRIGYEHDLAGRTETIIDALGGRTCYTYDEAGNVISFTDGMGNTGTYTYDEDGNALSETDPLGNTHRYTYDENGNPLTHTTANGDTWRSASDEDGNPTAITDPLGNTATATYDDLGRLVSVTDAMGNTRSWSFDEDGNIVSRTNAAGETTTAEYNEFGDVTKITDPEGQVMTFEYDANGNRTSLATTRRLSNGDIRPVHVTYEYDEMNRLVSYTTADGKTFTSVYGPSGRVVEYLGPNGEHLSAYDFGDGKHIVGNHIGGFTSETVLDARGLLAHRTSITGDTTSYTYNADGQVTTQTRPGGGVLSATYDKAGRKTSISNPLGRSANFQYDAMGALTAAEDPMGHSTEYGWDAAAQPTRITDPRGNTTERIFDANGRLSQLHLPGGGSIEAEYDPVGRITSATDPLGNTTRYTYDNAGHLASVIDPLGHVTTYENDGLGHIIRVTDAEGRVTKIDYDDQGRRIAVTLPLGQQATWTYDDLGNLVASVDFNGNETTYTYEGSRRLDTVTYADGSVETYDYSADLKQTTFTDSQGTTIMQLGPDGEMLRETKPDGRVITYTYDAAGQLLTRTSPVGTTTYTYNDCGQCTSVTAIDGGVTTYTYDEVGNVTRIQHPNGTSTRVQYDARNQITLLQHISPDGTVVASYAYVRNPAGNPLKVTELDGRTVEYTYDACQRLLSETVTESDGEISTVVYTYDKVGNRLTRTDADGTTTYVYDDNDRLLTDGVTTYSYDAAGNLLSAHDDHGNSLDIEWNARGRIRRVTRVLDGVSTVTEYEYSGGIRIRTTVNGTDVTNYLVDRNRPHAQVLQETDADGVEKAAYDYGRMRLFRRTAAGTQTYHHDGSGSVRYLSDAAGTLTDAYAYDAFGVSLRHTGASTNPYQYRGERLDAVTGMYHLRARDMDPSTGRFLSRDPAKGDPRNPGTFHPYMYAMDNPLGITDPSGATSLVECLSVATIISTLCTINAALITADYHPFTRGAQFDGLNSEGSYEETTLMGYDHTFKGDWIQMNSAFNISWGVGMGKLVSRALPWNQWNTATVHTTLDFSIDVSAPSSLSSVYSGGTPLETLIFALTGLVHSAENSDWWADTQNIRQDADRIWAYIESSALFSGTVPSITINIGFSRVWGATTSGHLDGLGLSGGISGKSLGLGFGLSMSFGMDTSPAQHDAPEIMVFLSYWNGSWAFGGNLGVEFTLPGAHGSDPGASMGFSLAYKEKRPLPKKK